MQPDIRIIIFSLSGLISDPIDVFPIDFEAASDPEAPFPPQHSIQTIFGALCTSETSFVDGTVPQSPHKHYV